MGVISDIISKRHVDYFKQMLVVDSIRGMDSTGAACILKDSAIVIKKAMNALDFIDLQSVDRLINPFRNQSTKAFIGHNRAATIGAINNDNAHPFQHEHITLAHNGSVHNLTPLKNMLDLGFGEGFGTDSELIAYSVSKVGIEETIKYVDGAFALVIHDSKAQTITLCRNDKRPLFFAQSKDYKEVYFGSEKSMIAFITDRLGITSLKMWDCAAGGMATFDLNSDKPGWYDYKTIKLYEPPAPPKQNKSNVLALPSKSYYKQKLAETFGFNVGEKIQFWTSEYVKYHKSSPRGYVTGVATEEPWMSVEIRGVKPGTIEESKEYIANLLYVDKSKASPILILDSNNITEVKEDTSYLLGPSGYYIPKSRWLQLVKDGCGNCSGDIKESEERSLIWVDNSPICGDCKELREVKQ